MRWALYGQHTKVNGNHRRDFEQRNKIWVLDRVLGSGAQLAASFDPREHLATSRESSGCHDSGGATGI